MRSILLMITAFLPLALWAQDKHNVELLYHWEDTTIHDSSNLYGNKYNEVWGYVKNGREYAIIGSLKGTHIIDVTDPANTTELHFIPGREQGPQVVHRDYHDYKDYLYAVCDEGAASTLQIIDLSALPASAPLVYDTNALFRRVHNIFIDTANSLLYACSVSGGIQGYSAMRVYSLNDPLNPQLQFVYNGVATVHDAFVEDNIAYLNCGTDGLRVMDFSTPDSGKLVGILDTYTEQGYNHSGWKIRDNPFYVFTDETWGLSLKVCNVADLSTIEVIGTFSAGKGDSSIAHNVITHNSYAYVSYYYDGLQVFDISILENPERVAWYDTYPGDYQLSYEGAWGVYPFLPSGNILVSDMQTGLYIFEVDVPTAVMETGSTVDIQVYPNPTSDRLFLKLPIAWPSGVVVNIYSVLGDKLSSQKFNGDSHFELELPANIPDGLLYVEVVTNSYRSMTKVLKTSGY